METIWKCLHISISKNNSFRGNYSRKYRLIHQIYLLGTSGLLFLIGDDNSGALLQNQIFASMLHSYLDGPILSKKLPLCQNGLQLNWKCLKFIDKHFPSLFLLAFSDLDTFSCIFCPFYGQNEKLSKILGNFHVDFLPIFYQKVKNYFWLDKMHLRFSN